MLHLEEMCQCAAAKFDWAQIVAAQGDTSKITVARGEVAEFASGELF